MSTRTFDPAQYKVGQHQQWEAVASGWEKWWEVIEKGAQGVSDRLVELAEVKLGDHVLDVATGVGEPAVTAARRVGGEGRVTAIDFSPQMLAIAQDRSERAGFNNIEFLEKDAENLDFLKGSFDAVLSRWGLNFLPDLPAALEQIHSLLVLNGKMATNFWDAPQKVPMLSLPMKVVREMLQLPPPPAGAPSVFGPDADSIEKTFREAGFKDVHSEQMTMTVELPSTADYVSMMQDVTAPIQAALAEHPPERKFEVWKAVEGAASRFASEEGTIRMENSTICVVGTR